LTFKDLEPKDVIPNGGGGAAWGGGGEGDELSKLEKDLVLVAACGIKDPLRKEVPEAVRKCQVSLFLYICIYMYRSFSI